MNFNNSNNQNLDGTGFNQGYRNGEENGFGGTSNFAENQMNEGTQGMGNQPYNMGLRATTRDTLSLLMGDRSITWEATTPDAKYSLWVE